MLFLFVPGILAAVIIDTFTTHRRKQLFHFIIHSFLLGVASYLSVSILIAIMNFIAERFTGERSPLKTTFIESLFNSKQEISVWEVVFASGIGLLLAILVVSVINDKLLYTFAQRINLSDKHGEDDVFEFFLGQDHIQWITVRDPETNLIYQGIITSFSQKDDKRELILSSVEAFRDENGQITEAGEYAYMYFNFDVNSKIILEVNNQ